MAEHEAQERMRAAKLCATSMYAGIAGLLFLLLPLFGGVPSAAAGLAAVVLGVWGLVRLGGVGMGNAGTDASPYERVGARMARRTRPQGFVGILIGLVLIGIPIVLLMAARKQQEETAAMWDAIRADLDIPQRAGGGETPAAPPTDPETDAAAAAFFHRKVQAVLPNRSLQPPPPVIWEEVAHRLHVLVATFPESRIAREIAGVERPESPMLGRCWEVLRAHPAASVAEARATAIAALLDAIESGHHEAKAEAADLLGGMRPVAKEALPRLEELRTSEDPLTRSVAERALRQVNASG